MLLSYFSATEYCKIYSIYSMVYEQFKVNLIPSRFSTLPPLALTVSVGTVHLKVHYSIEVTIRANTARDTQPFVRFLASERTTEVTSLSYMSLPLRRFQGTGEADVSTAKYCFVFKF